MLNLRETIDVNNTLGEGVVWHAKSQSVWWTDIEQKKLYTYQVNQKELSTFNTPYRLCAFGFTKKETTIIAAFDCGIALYNYGTQAIFWLFKLPKNSFVRFNDGRIDAMGRFWVGTMNESDQKSESAGLYRVDNDLSVTKIFSGVGITNGLAWNNQASTFYIADSLLQTIFHYDFDLHYGVISNEQVFALTHHNVFPDGAIVDSQDNLWSAHWGGGCLVRYGLNGDRQVYDMPVSQPTCVAFGGEKNNLLFVSTANYGLSQIQKADQPLAGSLLIFDSEITGTDSPIFSAKELTNV